MVSRIRKSCTEHVSECCLYPRDPSPVPNTFRVRFVPRGHLLYRTRFGVRFVPQRPLSYTEHVSSAVRTPEAPLLYRTRFGVRFVPQGPISCTEHVSECGLYTRGPSPVPYMFRRVVRTPEAPLLYQTRFECGSYPISPSPVPNCDGSGFHTSESLILCLVSHDKCAMWLLVYGKYSCHNVNTG